MSKPGNYILIFFLVLITKEIYGTAQFPDILLDGEDTVAIFSNPLEQYLDKKKDRVFCGKKLEMSSTACYRGYLAFWMIRDDKLYLTKVLQGCGESDQKEFKLNSEFGQNKVFADWFTGIIMCPGGELLQYIHSGYGSIYEKEKFIYITNGLIDSVVVKSYLKYDISLLNPSERLLRDTLRKIIIQNLDANKILDFPDSLVCRIEIQFDSTGRIDTIFNGYSHDGISIMEEYMLSIAKIYLRDLPRLMTVTHDKYFPPIVSLYFSAHCLKYPNDSKYGCNGSNTTFLESILMKVEKNLIVWVTIVFITILFIIFLIYRRQTMMMK